MGRFLYFILYPLPQHLELCYEDKLQLINVSDQLYKEILWRQCSYLKILEFLEKIG